MRNADLPKTESETTHDSCRANTVYSMNDNDASMTVNY